MAHAKDKDLAEQYHATQDPALREEMILRYLPLVHYVLGRLGISSDIGSDYEDMISQGLLGLMDACNRYNPGYGTQFSTYAIIKIRGKVLDYMRSLDWLTRTARSRARMINEAVNSFFMENHRAPTEAELAQNLKLDIAQVQAALVDSSRVLVSLDAFEDSESNDEFSMHETLADANQIDPAETVDETETKQQLITAIKKMPEREQLILSLYYYENLTLKEIGEVVGVSESRVCQIHAHSMLSLKAALLDEDNIPAKTRR